jgi:hypothetical protein
MQIKLLGIISVDFKLVTYFAFIGYWSKNGSVMRLIYQLFIDFKKAHGSVREEKLNIIIELSTPMNSVTLFKMCLNKPISKSIYVNICLMHFLFRMV